MKLATTTGDFAAYTKSQSEALAHIRNAGFRYADYSFVQDYAQRSGVFGVDYRQYYDRINETQAALGLRIVQAHAPMGKPLLEDGGVFLADTIRCVEACGAWGVENLVVHSGYLPGLTPEETFLKNRAFFMPILQAAEKHGVNILVENFNKMNKENVYWIDNGSDLLKMIQCVDHPLFHAVWDVGHANLQTVSQDEELRLLGSHVHALHIHDNLGDWDTHLAPFLGTTNLDSVLHGLLDIGYSGYFTFEVGGIFLPPEQRREYAPDSRLKKAPLALRDAFERYLYQLGKTVLEAYNCFEE